MPGGISISWVWRQKRYGPWRRVSSARRGSHREGQTARGAYEATERLSSVRSRRERSAEGPTRDGRSCAKQTTTLVTGMKRQGGKGRGRHAGQRRAHPKGTPTIFDAPTRWGREDGSMRIIGPRRNGRGNCRGTPRRVEGILSRVLTKRPVSLRATTFSMSVIREVGMRQRHKKAFRKKKKTLSSPQVKQLFPTMRLRREVVVKIYLF